MRIVIPGGSGQVGRILARAFHAQGDHVTVLSRSMTDASAPWKMVQWDGRELGVWVHEIDGPDVVINLSGRSVNCRYTPANRREIMESRVEPTRLLGRAIREVSHPPALWMNASTATIYRHSLDRVMDEVDGVIGGTEGDAPSSWRFSIEVATAWENAFFKSPTPETRKLALRSSMIMSPDRGGVFDRLFKLVRLGLGGMAARGDQYISWIHDVDFVRAVRFLAANTDFEGCVNVCSPNPLPNREFMQGLGAACGVRIGLRASPWMLEMGAWLMRTETELLLKSRRVVPRRLLEAGFDFLFSAWPQAAQDLVARRRLGSAGTNAKSALSN